VNPKYIKSENYRVHQVDPSTFDSTQ